MENIINRKGTITWFNCTSDKPPIEGGKSVDVLLLNNHSGYIGIGKYHEAEVGRFVPLGGNWHPTHFAYVNYPEPTQD